MGTLDVFADRREVEILLVSLKNQLVARGQGVSVSHLPERQGMPAKVPGPSYANSLCGIIRK